MQTVNHKKPNIHPIFDSIERFYAFMSERGPRTSLLNPVFPCSFKEVYNLFTEYGKTKFDVKFNVVRWDKLVLPQYPKKNIIVCFSGGKDSVATALHYQKLGYNVYLYHVKGINKTYKDEYKAVQRLADYLGLPLTIEEVQLKGDHEWTEHPMKNMIIADMAIQYGIRENIGIKIAFGNYYTSHIYDDPFEVCAGDDIEMWRAYERIIKSVIPGFKMYIPLRNIQTSYNAINERPELLELIQSCIGPYRYREYLHDNNEKKYGIKLLSHRCGSCWKCAAEYIWYTDHKKLEYNEDFYKHCLQVLRNTVKKEDGIHIRSDRSVWQRYMFYPIKQSKYFA